MKIFLSSLFLFILLTCLYGCATTPQKPPEDIQKEADYNYKMGISSLNEGNIKMAYVQLHKAYELDPSNKDILNSLGIVFMQLGEDDKALSFFRRVIDLDSRYSEAYNNIGVIQLQRGNFEEAIKSFSMALNNPLYQYPERAYYNLGTAYYRLKRYDDAIRSFQSSIRLVNDFALSYYGLALTLNKKGDYGNAINMLIRAIAFDNKYKGNVELYKKDLMQKALIAKGTEAEDVADYLDILKY